MREWWSKIARAFQRRRGLDDDLREELNCQADLMVEDNIARGLPPGAARTGALLRLGNPTTTHERAREAWQFRALETFLQDVRHSLRGIRQAPGFSLLVILTLALGIGANTAIFSVIYAVLLRPLPYPAGERLVWLGESTANAAGISVTWINYQQWRGGNHSFEDLAGFTSADLTLTGRGDAVLTHAGVVSSQFFHLNVVATAPRSSLYGGR